MYTIESSNTKFNGENTTSLYICIMPGLKMFKSIKYTWSKIYMDNYIEFCLYQLIYALHGFPLSTHLSVVIFTQRIVLDDVVLMFYTFGE